MSQYTVEQFASELKLPVDLLIDQLKNAGVEKNNSSDELSEDDKAALLSFLKQSHGDSQKTKNKITLTRKQNSEIQKTDSSGKSRTIQVEVRKKKNTH
jgi:translation initiation factor IF-2